jgi:rhodanese-related sulfurtransferase
LEFGLKPQLLRSFAHSIGYIKASDWSIALVGSHLHETAVASMALIVAIAARQFGYRRLPTSPRRLARVGLLMLPIGVVWMTYIHVRAGFSTWSPPTWLQSRGGTNGIASDDVVMGVFVMGGGLLVLAPLALLGARRRRSLWRAPVRPAAAWSWFLSFATVAIAGYSIVDQLAKASGQSNANTSQHLQALHAAGLLARRREGARVLYALAGEDVLALWLALRDAAAARLAEVERAARDYLGEDVEAISRKELVERLERREIVLVDVRPAEEFAAAHIEGARSIPLSELEQHLEDLPRDAEIVAYCRGPYCLLAPRAVERLREHGLRARRLADGLPDWRQAGLPLAAPGAPR